jgi:hypothetical protein
MLVLNEDINFNTASVTPGLKWKLLDMRTGGMNPKKVGVLNTIPFIYNKELYITGLELNDMEEYSNNPTNELAKQLLIKPTIQANSINYIYKYNEETNVFYDRKDFKDTSLCNIEKVNGRNISVCKSENQIIIPIF